MIHLPLLTAALTLAATVFVASSDASDTARRRALPFALLLLAGNLGAAFFGGLAPSDATGVTAAFDPLSAALAGVLGCLVLALVAGTPTSGHAPAHLARVLATGAIGTIFLMLREPVLLALAWPLTAAPLLSELRLTAAHRRVLAHVGISGALVFAGVVAALLDASPLLSAGLVLGGVVAREGLFPSHGLVVHAHREAPFGAALLLTQPQLGLHLVARLGLGDLAGWRMVLLCLALATVLLAATSGLRARTPRELLLHATLGLTAISLAALASAGPTHDVVLLTLVVGTSLGALALALALLEAHGCSASLSTATLTLGLIAIVLPVTLVLIDANRRGWSGLDLALSGATVVGASLLVVPLARVAVPEALDATATVPLREGTALAGLALATILLALHADQLQLVP